MITRVATSVMNPMQRLLHSPFAFQLISITLLILFVLGFRPAYFVSGQQFGESFFGDRAVYFPISEPGFLDNFAGVSTAGLHEIIVTDDAGNTVVRIQPRNRTETVEYTVRSGENTVAKIAHKFGLNPSTILWANKLTQKEILQVGRTLTIPPMDGIFYNTQAGDTLDAIAKIHNVDTEKILTYNQIGSGVALKDGQSLFIPNAKKTFVPQFVASGRQAGVTQLSAIGFKLRRPTQGVLTQGYHTKHFALDIHNRMNTPIYASASGTVIKSDDGWNYGYGKYIIIDHGNGIQTLYGHNNVRKVEVGDEVKTGQLIALMGNSGNVFGPTGIHLHYEVRIYGRKVNPNSYF